MVLVPRTLPDIFWGHKQTQDEQTNLIKSSKGFIHSTKSGERLIITHYLQLMLLEKIRNLFLQIQQAEWSLLVLICIGPYRLKCNPVLAVKSMEKAKQWSKVMHQNLIQHRQFAKDSIDQITNCGFFYALKQLVMIPTA